MTAVRFRFRPLGWAGPSTPLGQRRSRNAFRAGYQDTLDRVTYEVASLGATEAVIEAGFREQDIRLDGRPRANAQQPDHPGIRLAFESRHGPLIYSTDAYEMWQHNLRAIALGLEALRAVDRYGVTHRGEQYAGWKALPSVDERTAARRAAAARLAELADSPTPPDPDDTAAIDVAYRAAARHCHPDSGGATDLFQELQQVIGVLR